MKLVALASLLAVMTTSALSQDDGRPFTLSIRGGVASALSSYPFAFRIAGSSEIDEVFEASFGSGPFVSVSVSTPDAFGNFGAEVGLSRFRLDGHAQTDPQNGNDNIVDLISLSHNRAVAGQETRSKTAATNVRALLTYDLPNYGGVQLLSGLGHLNYDHRSAGQIRYPGDTSSQSRSASFKGAGFVFGARQNLPDIWSGFDLHLEGTVGLYRGSRTLRIVDSYLEAGGGSALTGTLDVDRTQTVQSIGLSASVLRPAPLISPNAKLELGVTYSKIFNVIDTSNYNQSVTGFFGEAARGDVGDDFATAALFVGLAVPF